MLLAQLSDLHLSPTPPLRGVHPLPALERAMHTLTRLPVDELLITGDLCNNGELEGYLELRNQLGLWAKPVHLVPGNHDNLAAMLRAFPGLAAHVQTWGRLLQVVEHPTLRLILLDTTTPGQHFGSLDGPTLDWLDRTLQARPGCSTLIAMHHPPVPLGIPFMDALAMRAGDAKDLAQVLQQHPQVRRLVCGHVHRCIMSEFAGRPCISAPSTAHQIAYRPHAEDHAAYTLEPPGLLLHHLRGHAWASHVQVIGDYPGPFAYPE